MYKYNLYIVKSTHDDEHNERKYFEFHVHEKKQTESFFSHRIFHEISSIEKSIPP